MFSDNEEELDTTCVEAEVVAYKYLAGCPKLCTIGQGTFGSVSSHVSG
jgi:hypothetical protein